MTLVKAAEDVLAHVRALRGQHEETDIGDRGPFEALQVAVDAHHAEVERLTERAVPVNSEEDCEEQSQDWRIGLAVTPKFQRHDFYRTIIFVVRKVENEMLTLYGRGTYGREINLVEPADNWVTA